MLELHAMRISGSNELAQVANVWKNLCAPPPTLCAQNAQAQWVYPLGPKVKAGRENGHFSE